MAGYGNVPTDRNASSAVIDQGSYLGDRGAAFSKLSDTEVGIIVGVTVFFTAVIATIFTWQFRKKRARARACAEASDAELKQASQTEDDQPPRAPERAELRYDGSRPEQTVDGLLRSLREGKRPGAGEV
ncbi:hypothetical protein MGG_02791 [Pyricularia oryzae 70-15]|uniref:Uncharacterized protein n=3 Tax=Pyricularia oryzae TaxID=318829 RepID=G5EGX0_PYRO7|nr:uncharacterized protein MGG_02791 [Pyricularia oryzae 70-15]ELQ41099.1 hypothetical protein OOU_Y34scaffold00301g19 [Pyricularia oryzae Y34]KAI7920512.1 hypothetical protein M9X92_005819 [Pyricularia oryzae]EAQ71137.1 hypothetical protein MGCH7_ch7g544 [Pyricularia oryzae 70-15]EHA46207.1 hypothetical protein MGG_02791 [Pyricularia oryzae 70-15]KAI7925316.1 hypothetical protein M0657_004292 [Pyricularia oryzae]